MVRHAYSSFPAFHPSSLQHCWGGNADHASQRSERAATRGDWAMTTTLDDRARKLVEDNLPLVRHVVFQVAVHFPRHVDRDELATAGAVGLVEAARRYEDGRGVPFERFAARRIRGAILDAV